MGGHNKQGTVNTIYLFDPYLGTVEEVPEKLPVAVKAHSQVIIDDIVYMMTGFTDPPYGGRVAIRVNLSSIVSCGK